MFRTMQTCMQKYPTLYNKEIGEDDDMTQAIEQSQGFDKKTTNDGDTPKATLDEMTKKEDNN